MALKTITKLVVDYSEIPSELTQNHWLNEHTDVEYYEVHIELDEDGSSDDPLQDWLAATYPELVDENSFYIHMDKDEN